MANEAEQAIYNRLASAPTFHPATADIFATDWGLDAGDVVAVRSGNDTYNVPVYNMSLNWKGNSRVQIQSTGNETRKPLSALKRRQYGGGSARHKEIEELGVQYSQQFVVSDKRVASIMSATGVLLDENNEPVTAYNPDTGEYEYVFDTTGAGATLASHVSQTAGKLETEVTARTAQGETLNSRITQTATEINSTVSALDGRVSEIKQTVDGITLTGNTITIKGNSIDLDGYVTIDNLSSEISNIENLYVENITAEDSIDCLNLSSRNLNVDNTVDCGDLVADSITLGGSAFTSVIVDASVSGNTLTLTKDDGTTVNFNKGGVITSITKSSQTWKPALFTHGGFEVGVYASGNNVGTYSDTIEVDGAYAWSAGWQEGYDEGEADGEAKFVQATVTPQGAAETVYVEDSTNGTDYYTAGTAVSYRQAGTKMSKVTMYGSGGTVTPISTKHKRTYYGALYSSGAAGAAPVGYGAWYLWKKETDAPLYEAASSSVYRRGTENNNCYVEDPNGAYLMAGSSVTVTPINNSSKITIKSDTRYAQGTPDSTTYYTKQSS